MKRYFAPILIDPSGDVHKMAVAEMAGPGAPLKIYPFEGEIASTLYLGPKIQLTISKEGELRATYI